MLVQWKEHVYPFDHVLNQTTYGWTWGSGETIGVFSNDHVFSSNYSTELENQAKQSVYLAQSLDRWVRDDVSTLLRRSMNDTELHHRLNQDKIMFFLNLLGTDTIGHNFSPESFWYLDNVSHVDTIVKQIVTTFNDYYKDNRTAFVLTSDHGMMETPSKTRGMHGDDNPLVTRSPVVVWGAGIHGNVTRVDNQHRNFAPFMASLIGVNIPQHSTGKVPVEYYANRTYAAEALLANTRQLMEQYRVKLGRSGALYDTSLLKQLIQSGETQEALVKGKRLEQQAIDAVLAMDHYAWPLLLSTGVLGYLGWMCFLVVTIHESMGKQGHWANVIHCRPYSLQVDISAALVQVVLWVYIGLVHGKLRYMVYTVFPVFFWRVVVQKWRHVMRIVDDLDYKIFLALSVVLLELLILGMYYRILLFVATCLLALWPLLLRPDHRRRHIVPLVASSVLFIVLGCFVFVPGVQTHTRGTATFTSILSAGIAMVVFTLTGWYVTRSWTFLHHLANLIGAAVYVSTVDTVYAFQDISQVVILLSTALAFIVSRKTQERLLSIMTSLFPISLLYSASYDALLFSVLCATLLVWVWNASKYVPTVDESESLVSSEPSHPTLSTSHIRTAVFLVALTLLSLVITLDLSSCEALLANPEYAISKLLFPLVIVGAAYGYLERTMHLSVTTLALLCSACSAWIALHLLFFGTNRGSWTEMGYAMIRYGLVNVCYLLLLCWVMLGHVIV
jgi:phosphatidylinositol glycan class N